MIEHFEIITTFTNEGMFCSINLIFHNHSGKVLFERNTVMFLLKFKDLIKLRYVFLSRILLKPLF